MVDLGDILDADIGINAALRKVVFRPAAMPARVNKERFKASDHPGQALATELAPGVEQAVRESMIKFRSTRPRNII